MRDILYGYYEQGNFNIYLGPLSRGSDGELYPRGLFISELYQRELSKD